MAGNDQNRIVLAFFTMLAIALGLNCGLFVYAKYYSVSSREGIAIATGVYFTANYAVDSGNEEFVESLVSSGYNGGDASFSLEVRNYENNLLFNTNNVDIPYIVELWLESDPTDGAVYSVAVGENGNPAKMQLRGGEANLVSIDSQCVEGGAARENSYDITLEAPEGGGHTPIPVYVRVRTLSGSLISRTLTGKMILSSTGKTESRIASQQFVIPDEPADQLPFERLTGLASFTYEILTVGSLESSGVTEEIKLSWDPSVLSIDLYDKAYMKWLEAEQSVNPGVNGPYEDEDNAEWLYITIDVMPYSAEKVNFFRGNYFDANVTGEKDEEKLESLEGFIDAKKIITTT